MHTACFVRGACLHLAHVHAHVCGKANTSVHANTSKATHMRIQTRVHRLHLLLDTPRAVCASRHQEHHPPMWCVRVHVCACARVCKYGVHSHAFVGLGHHLPAQTVAASTVLIGLAAMRATRSFLGLNPLTPLCLTCVRMCRVLALHASSQRPHIPRVCTCICSHPHALTHARMHVLARARCLQVSA